MLLIVLSCLIAILASVSADCYVGKSVEDFDFKKISTVTAVCRGFVFESRHGYGCASLSSVVFVKAEYYA